MNEIELGKKVHDCVNKFLYFLHVAPVLQDLKSSSGTRWVCKFEYFTGTFLSCKFEYLTENFFRVAPSSGTCSLLGKSWPKFEYFTETFLSCSS